MARPETFKTPLGRRLADVRKHLGHSERKSFAEILDMKADTLGTYERGISEPDAALLGIYRKRFGVNLSWLITGEGDMFDDPSKVPTKPLQVDPKLMQKMLDTMEQVADATLGSPMRQKLRPFEPRPPKTMRYYPTIIASAGAGHAVLEEPDFAVELDAEQLATQIIGAEPEQIFLFRIKGDSMLPTLANGDYAVVEEWINGDPENDQVCVVSVGGNVYVKRAEWTKDGLSWKSDNDLPENPTIFVPDNELQNMKVHGEVISYFRSMRRRRRT